MGWLLERRHVFRPVDREIEGLSKLLFASCALYCDHEVLSYDMCIDWRAVQFARKSFGEVRRLEEGVNLFVVVTEWVLMFCSLWTHGAGYCGKRKSARDRSFRQVHVRWGASFNPNFTSI